MKLKKFIKDDFISVWELCSKAMYLDKISKPLLEEKIFSEPDFADKLTLLAVDESKGITAGFVQGVVKQREEEKIGYVKLFCVHPDFRRQKIGSALYQSIEEEIKSQNVNRIRVYESYPNYFMPGIDPFYTEAVCFFERNGFKKFNDTSNLLADLAVQKFDTSSEEKSLADEGIICRRAEQEDKVRILKWAENAFRLWIPEVTESFSNKPVTLFICEVDGEVKAFSAHEVNNKGTGWFGPMGTDASLRGKGIGGILLRKSLQDMKEMGFTHAVIPWVGPIPFYMHYANARVQRVFWRYEKILE